MATDFGNVEVVDDFYENYFIGMMGTMTEVNSRDNERRKGEDSEYFEG